MGVGVDRVLSGSRHRPRLLDCQAHHAGQRQSEDRLVRHGAGQVQSYLPLQHVDPDSELDQAQPQCVELRGAPGRTARHQRAQVPHQPVGADMEEQAHLIGTGAAA